MSRVLSGEKVQPVSREIGVHRTSVYIWKERALVALKEALEPHKRGSKFKYSRKTPDKNTENLKEEIDRLKGYLEEKERQIHLLREKLEPQKDDLKPARSPNCGCEKVYKNGTCKIKPKGFLKKWRVLFSKVGLDFSLNSWQKKNLVTINNEVKSLVKEELKTGPGGGEKINRPLAERKESFPKREKR